jgi:hypothetical protein
MKNLGSVTKSEEEVLSSYRAPNKPNSIRDLTPRTNTSQKHQSLQLDHHYQQSSYKQQPKPDGIGNINLHDMIKSYIKVTP